LQLSSAYADDLIAVGDPEFLDLVHDKIGSLVGDGRAPGLCSAVSAINESKDVRGTLVEILGWLFDVPSKSVHPNYLTFAKLVYSFFTAIGDTPFAGQRLSVRVLMVMGAHAMRSANILTTLLGHNRSFHNNIRGNCNPSSYVYLTQSTVNDIMLWRALLTPSFTDARVLRAPTYSPLLLMNHYQIVVRGVFLVPTFGHILMHVLVQFMILRLLLRLSFVVLVVTCLGLHGLENVYRHCLPCVLVSTS
jgi:hypothetical protein